MVGRGKVEVRMTSANHPESKICVGTSKGARAMKPRRQQIPNKHDNSTPVRVATQSTGGGKSDTQLATREAYN